MPIRLPKEWWEWALQFAPAAAILLAVGYEKAFIPRGGTIIVGLDSALFSAWFAIPLCFLAAFFLTTPHPSLALRVFWIVLLAIGVAVVNCGIAFGGYLLLVG